MREIKFRAWHKILKKMDEVTAFCPPRRLVYVWSDELSWTFSDIELMQYTGYKDARGDAIYEGDVIQTHMMLGEIRVGKVVWSAPGDSHLWQVGETWMLQFENGPPVPLMPFCDERNVYRKTYIIGNIYQHPKILP